MSGNILAASIFVDDSNCLCCVPLENQPIGSSSASANTARPIQRRHTEPHNAGNPSTSFSALNRIATQPEGSSKKLNVHRTMSRTFSLRRAATSMLQPPKKIGPAPTVWKSIRSVLLSSCQSPSRLSFPSSRHVAHDFL